MVLRAATHWLLACSFALAGPACRGEDQAGRCDLAAVEQTRAAMVAAAAAWTPSSGKPPADHAVAIEGLWRACPGMPPGFRSFLDLSYTHPRPQWQREGLVEPPDAGAAMEAKLPGHETVHRGYERLPIYEDPEVLRVEAKVCPDARSVFDEVHRVAGDQRGPTLFDGCDLGRFGMFAREELGREATQAFAGLLLAQWLISTGVPSATAGELGRTLGLRRDELVDTEIHDLPHVASGFVTAADTFLPERVLLASPTGIDFTSVPDWSPGRGLPEGEALQWEYDSLRRGMIDDARKPEHLRIVGDPRTPWSIVALGVAAGRTAGYVRVDALVLVPSIREPFAWLPLDAGVLPTDPALLRISSTEWRVSRAGAVTSVPPGGSLSAALAGAGGVLLQPEPGLTLQAVLTAAAALGADLPRRVQADPPAK